VPRGEPGGEKRKVPLHPGPGRRRKKGGNSSNFLPRKGVKAWFAGGRKEEIFFSVYGEEREKRKAHHHRLLLCPERGKGAGGRRGRDKKESLPWGKRRGVALSFCGHWKKRGGKKRTPFDRKGKKNLHSTLLKGRKMVIAEIGEGGVPH